MSPFLVDKSAFEQQRHSAAADEVLTLLAVEGQLAICDVIALELLYSTRSAAEYELRRRHLHALSWLPMHPEVHRTARDLQQRLALRGQHRRPIPDLLIAATALVHEATVLHYDKDFDAIAEISSLRAQWIIPRGTGHSSTGG